MIKFIFKIIVSIYRLYKINRKRFKNLDKRDILEISASSYFIARQIKRGIFPFVVKIENNSNNHNFSIN